jgi:hypothetical protein
VILARREIEERPVEDFTEPEEPNWPSNRFGRLRSINAAAAVAEAGSRASNGNVSHSRTGSGPLAARAARNGDCPRL